MAGHKIWVNNDATLLNLNTWLRDYVIRSDVVLSGAWIFVDDY